MSSGRGMRGAAAQGHAQPGSRGMNAGEYGSECSFKVAAIVKLGSRGAGQHGGERRDGAANGGSGGGCRRAPC